MVHRYIGIVHMYVENGYTGWVVEKKKNDAIKNPALGSSNGWELRPDIPTYFAHKPHNRKSRSGRSTWLGGQAFFYLLYALGGWGPDEGRDGIAYISVCTYIPWLAWLEGGGGKGRLKKISYAAQLKISYHVLHSLASPS